MPGVVRVVSVSTGAAVEREAAVVVVEATVDQLLATIHPNTNPEEGKP
ncbi:Putative acyl-CoA carboxylase alpha subunit AccA [Mycobacteroides abscessus subsp. abscessus]|nr:Putative acyl-CoA carboxylase alpha subunit AccA [Mycobacteroides abscessus subsp. abscessus]